MFVIDSRGFIKSEDIIWLLLIWNLEYNFLLIVLIISFTSTETTFNSLVTPRLIFGYNKLKTVNWYSITEGQISSCWCTEMMLPLQHQCRMFSQLFAEDTITLKELCWNDGKYGRIISYGRSIQISLSPGGADILVI